MFARVIATSIALLGISSAHAMTLTSSDFKNGATLPTELVYPRCGGKNISPALSWSGVPADTKSIVITLIDTSVKPSGWSHWIVVGLPPDTASLAKGVKTLPGAATATPSNFGDPYYDGPCPPPGSGIHTYEFTVWALKSAAPPISSDEKATDLEAVLGNLSLAKASLTATVKG
jgi:Raf kinase inhibitor-like YbhB/YbcL family protein